MTLVVTINGPETIWLLADRRLSYRGHPPKDDARKLMFLDTTDGIAILGYAGLGAAALGTEPADWMSSVFRGRNLPLEQSLGVLAEAIKQQLPRHLVQLAGAAPAHNVLVPAFIGEEARAYSIDLAFAADRESYSFRYTRHILGGAKQEKMITPPIAIGGSGAYYLYKDKRWARQLKKLVRACDRGRILPDSVADRLAGINYKAHLGTADGSVGPRCIVAWRHRKGGSKKGGGSHQFYTGTKRDANCPALPEISQGTDISALLAAVTAHMVRSLEDARAGRAERELNKDDLDLELARLPAEPDEELR